MVADVLDQMLEFAIGELASGQPQRIARLVRVMAAKWPDEKALTISFALTSAASELEDIFSGPQNVDNANRAYRLAALVAADVLAAEAMGRQKVTGRDLQHYWRRMDPYFLNIEK